MSVPIYNALIVELERRRQAIGLSQEKVSELAGTADRSYAKLIAPETASGRLARWDTLQVIVDVLFCNGYVLRVVPSKTAKPIATGTQRKIIQEAVDFDRKTLPELMSEIGMRGGRAYREKVPAEKRSKAASKAARARWKRVRQQQKEAGHAAPSAQP